LAIAQFEEPAPDAEAAREPSREALELAATALLMAGKHEDLERLAQKLGDQMTPSIRESVAWSRIGQGSGLADQAKSKAGEEADALFRAAGEKYAAALAIKPDKHEALYNWGTALSDQAESKAGEEADALFRAAGKKYAQALAIKPDKHEALNNWGSALSEQAKSKAGEEADALFRAAGEKYAQALAIKPDMHEALNNWATALADQARTKVGEEAGALFEQARAKLLQAEELKEGAGAYNLACVAALREQEDECREWLHVAKRCGTLPDREHLLGDADFVSMRDKPWFQEFLARS
jgi:Tfp pilus assembly protein PilF